MTDALSPSSPAGLGPLGTGAMFDRIAHRYDLLNRVLSLGLDHGWRRRASAALGLAPEEHGEILDLATGTGDLAIAVARMHPSARVLGTDPSPNMLAIGQTKIEALGGRVRLTTGDAQAIEAADGAFAGVTIAFGIRNVPDRDRALREMTRVCRSGGRVVVLELGEPNVGILGPLARFHVRHVVPRIGALLSGAREYRYLQTSIAAFPPAPEFARKMEGAGLTSVGFTPLTFGACTLYRGTKP
jgi:demethylmenaquinone methyltransferase/2-methoxy-6-polyprenyl-1,4-benzoquinol methylase